MSKEFKLPEGWGCKTRHGDGYESPNVSDDEANKVALKLLQGFDGLPVPVIRQVLRQAEFWLGAVTVLDCGPDTEFARAAECYSREIDGNTENAMPDGLADAALRMCAEMLVNGKPSVLIQKDLSALLDFGEQVAKRLPLSGSCAPVQAVDHKDC